MKKSITKLNQTKKDVKKSHSSKSKPPLRTSNFFMTFNTNLNGNSMTKEDYEKYYKITDEMVSSYLDDLDKQQILQCTPVKSKKEYPGYDNEEKDYNVLLKRIEGEVQIDQVIEIGAKSKLHCHVLIKIKKRNLNNRIDIKKTREYLNKKWEELTNEKRNIYFNVKGSGSSTINLQDYLEKTLR